MSPQQHADAALQAFAAERRVIRAERIVAMETCRLFARPAANRNDAGDDVDRLLALVRNALREA